MLENLTTWTRVYSVLLGLHLAPATLLHQSIVIMLLPKWPRSCSASAASSQFPKAFGSSQVGGKKINFRVCCSTKSRCTTERRYCRSKSKTCPKYNYLLVPIQMRVTVPIRIPDFLQSHSAPSYRPWYQVATIMKRYVEPQYSKGG